MNMSCLKKIIKSSTSKNELTEIAQKGDLFEKLLILLRHKKMRNDRNFLLILSLNKEDKRIREYARRHLQP